MNILTAWILFTVLFVHGTQPLGISSNEDSRSYLMPSQTFLEEKGFLSGSVYSGVKVTDVLSDSLADTHGIEKNMVIHRLNNISVDINNFSTMIASFSNQTFTLDV